MLKVKDLLTQLTGYSEYALDEFDKIKLEFFYENDIPDGIIIEEISDEKAIAFSYKEEKQNQIKDFINQSSDFSNIQDYLNYLKNKFIQKASTYLKNKDEQLNRVADCFIKHAHPAYIQSLLDTEDREILQITLQSTIQDMVNERGNNNDIQIINKWQTDIGTVEPDIIAIKNLKEKLLSRARKEKLKKQIFGNN